MRRKNGAPALKLEFAFAGFLRKNVSLQKKGTSIFFTYQTNLKKVSVHKLILQKNTMPLSSSRALFSTIAFLVVSLSHQSSNHYPPRYGRISNDEYILTPEQIKEFHSNGCCTLEDVLTSEEVDTIETTFNKFLNREIHVPGKDFCDMSKPFDTPFENWSIVNCMLPTKYHPAFENNVYERISACIARQLFPKLEMTKDYDQLLNKRPGKSDAVFSWHQDMGYWPSPDVLGVKETSTCTFSLAVDDSMEENGCLRYVVGTHLDKKLRLHKPLASSRDDGHALTIEVDESKGDVIKLAKAKR